MLSLTECTPARIVQIVSGSRTGSSLLKELLARSPNLVALDGEDETYVKYSGSGFGLTSNSDALERLVHPGLYRRLLQTELEMTDPRARWEWRLRLQFTGLRLARLLDHLPEMDPAAPVEWLRCQGVYGHYDGCPAAERLPFPPTESAPYNGMAYEMPPFVQPRLTPCLGMDEQTLLIKSPYHVYRPGMLEQTFPDSTFRYILLIRSPAATVNGLIDGWEAPYGFHKHLLPPPVGWWKFDLPLGWSNYVTAPTSERCWYQWESSAVALQSRGAGLVVRFEDLLANPTTTLTRITKYLDIPPLPTPHQLPVTMATTPPRPGRWRDRAATIVPLLRRSAAVVRDLGYAEDLCHD